MKLLMVLFTVSRMNNVANNFVEDYAQGLTQAGRSDLMSMRPA